MKKHFKVISLIAILALVISIGMVGCTTRRPAKPTPYSKTTPSRTTPGPTTPSRTTPDVVTPGPTTTNSTISYNYRPSNYNS